MDWSFLIRVLIMLGLGVIALGVYDWLVATSRLGRKVAGPVLRFVWIAAFMGWTMQVPLLPSLTIAILVPHVWHRQERFRRYYEARVNWGHKQLAEAREQAREQARRAEQYPLAVKLGSSTGLEKASIILPAPDDSDSAVGIRYSTAGSLPEVKRYASYRSARKALSAETSTEAAWVAPKGAHNRRHWPPERRLFDVLSNLWVCHACAGDLTRSSAAFHLMTEFKPEGIARPFIESVEEALAPPETAPDCVVGRRAELARRCGLRSGDNLPGLYRELRACLEALKTDVPGA